MSIEGTQTPATPEDPGRPGGGGRDAGQLPPLGENPFVGPRPLEPGERLFGRARESRELFLLLSSERIVWLHSPSGAGKTSLIQTSLTRLLRRDRFAVCPPIRVGADLPDGVDANPYVLSTLLALEESLPEDRRRPPAELAVLGLPDYLAQRSRADLDHGHAGTVLIFDQFEEVLTHDPMDRESKVAFFKTLGEALRNDSLWCLFALREEYLSPLEPYVDWIPTRWANTFRLDLLDEPAVGEILRRTAEQGGRTFTDAAADQLFRDLAHTKVQQPDGSFIETTGRFAEPVTLQVVCRRLWDAMPEDDRSIDPEDLARFGDVSEALGAYYDGEIGAIARDDQGLERRIRSWFGERLIAPGGIRAQVLRRADDAEGLPTRIVDALVETHLIRAEKRAGATWYELAHDRLVGPVLDSNRAWQDANLQPFQRQAALWVKAGRPPGGGDQLLRGTGLRRAIQFQRQNADLVNEDEQRLIEISRSAQRLRLWTRVGLGAFTAVIIGAAVAGWVLFEQARAQERKAWYQLARGHMKDGISARDRDNGLYRAAHQFAAAARRFHQTGPAQGHRAVNARLALAQLLDQPLLEAVLDGHSDHVRALFSSDGSRILTWGGDRTARLWDGASGAPLTPPIEHEDWVAGAALSGDATRILTWGYEDTAWLWDSVNGTSIAPPLKHEDSFSGAAFSADGTRLLTWSADGTARLWDSDSGAALIPPLKHEGSVSGAVFSRDGSRILTWSWDGTARLWDGVDGDALIPPLEHEGLVLGAAFSRDETRILTWSADGTARLWDSASGASLTPPLKHEDSVSGAAFSADASRLLTWSDDGTARLWDSASGSPTHAAAEARGPGPGRRLQRR